MVARTAVTVQPYDIGQTGTLSRSLVALPGCLVMTQQVTHTLLAVVLCGVAIETLLAALAAEALCVVQTAQTLPSVGIAGAWGTDVYVAITGTRLTSTAWHQWVAKVIVSTPLTTPACKDKPRHISQGGTCG